MKLIVVTVLLATSIASPAVGTPTAAPRLCHGKQATIVGEPGRALRGTKRGDVIVTNGAGSVDASGGDDLVCVTGSNSENREVRVLGGYGDDLIDASDSQTQDGVRAVLGFGDDRYIGGLGFDGVSAAGEGTDRVATGGGDDVASAGGVRGRADLDVVRLGPGDDSVGDIGRDPTTRWFGGGGTDSMDLPYDGPRAARHDWVYDVPRHGTFRNGVRVQRWEGFDSYELGDEAPFQAYGRSLRFTGSSGPEQVFLSATTDRPTRVNLGDGSDRLDVETLTGDQAVASYVLTGGPGRDVFAPDGSYPSDGIYPGPTTPYLVVDLSGDVFRTQRHDAPSSSLKGFEDVVAQGYDEADVRGDAADNDLLWKPTCSDETSHLSGSDGHDVLAVGALFRPVDCDEDGQPGPTPRAVLDGGSGDDRLTGGDGADTLTGGGGTDTADGGPGTDACTAETTTACEGP